MFPELGSAIGGLVVVWAIFQQYMPPQLRKHAERYARKLASLVDPYVQIAFPSSRASGSSMARPSRSYPKLPHRHRRFPSQKAQGRLIPGPPIHHPKAWTTTKRSLMNSMA
ncbi:hypothetical protein NL676_014737 [Syzygium grande]|nr:hypothetical protein NL676_014737 [Syzygium grande]